MRCTREPYITVSETIYRNTKKNTHSEVIYYCNFPHLMPYVLCVLCALWFPNEHLITLCAWNVRAAHDWVRCIRRRISNHRHRPSGFATTQCFISRSRSTLWFKVHYNTMHISLMTLIHQSNALRFALDGEKIFYLAYMHMPCVWRNEQAYYTRAHERKYMRAVDLLCCCWKIFRWIVYGAEDNAIGTNVESRARATCDWTTTEAVLHCSLYCAVLCSAAMKLTNCMLFICFVHACCSCSEYDRSTLFQLLSYEKITLHNVIYAKQPSVSCAPAAATGSVARYQHAVNSHLTKYSRIHTAAHAQWDQRCIWNPKMINASFFHLLFRIEKQLTQRQLKI